MNIIIGAVTGLFFFVALILSFYLGYRFGTKTKPVQSQLSEEEKELVKQMHQGMQNIMNYDVSVAMKRGVTSG